MFGLKAGGGNSFWVLKGLKCVYKKGTKAVAGQDRRTKGQEVAWL